VVIFGVVNGVMFKGKFPEFKGEFLNDIYGRKWGFSCCIYML